LNKTVANGITITEVFEIERESFPVADEKTAEVKKPNEAEEQLPVYIKWGIAAVAVILVILYY
jgi:hypothetical protein